MHEDHLKGWLATSRIMEAVVKDDPKAGEEAHQERFWAAIQKTPKKDRDAILGSLARSYLSQRRTGVLRSMRTQAERDAERAEREALYKRHKKSAVNVVDQLDAVIEKKVRQILGEASH